MHASTRSLLGALALLPLAACGGGGGGTDGGATAPAGAPTGDLLLSNVPSDELLYLNAEVESLVLEAADGSLTPNLLGGPVTVDLQAHQDVAAWLAKSELPTGSYVAARATFDPLAFAAAGPDGTPIVPTVADTTLRAAFPSAVVTGPGSYSKLTLSMDVPASFGGSLQAGAILTPTGSGAASGGDDGVAVDEIQGTVLSSNPAAGALRVDAFADGDLTAPLGQVDVSVTPTTFLVGDDDVPFASQAAFFGALVPGQTRVEVHGLLQAGQVAATKIEIEDGFGAGGEIEVEVRGKVVGHQPGVGLELLWTHVEQGAATFQSVLAGLGQPAVIDVAITPQTKFELGQSQPTTETSLTVGQVVEVKFVQFASEPFPAHEIEIEDAFPEYEGFLTDVAGLPNQVTMTLKASQPAIWSGDVASTQTPVVVALAGAGIVLDLGSEPALAASDLSVGLEVKVHGSLSGPPTAPTVAAQHVEVREGELDGATVGTLSPGSNSFQTFGGEIDDPFGAGVLAGPLTVVLDPSCVFEGDVSSAAGFFAAGAGAEVDVEGIGDTSSPNTVRAYVVDVDLD